jgi:hypothetical protein
VCRGYGNPSWMVALAGLVPRVIVLHPHNVFFVRKVVEVGVDPEFGHDAHGFFADETVALPTLEGNEVAFDVVFGGEFFVRGAGGDGDGAFYHGPHLAAAIVVLPAETLAGVDHEDFGAQTHALSNGDAIDAGKELICKRLGVLFRDNEESTPGTGEVLVDDGEAEGLNPGGGFFHLSGFMVGLTQNTGIPIMTLGPMKKE